jgi:hypothetical protein
LWWIFYFGISIPSIKNLLRSLKGSIFEKIRVLTEIIWTKKGAAQRRPPTFFYNY